MPAANPRAMLEIIRARNACSLSAMIRASSRAMAAAVMTIRYGPFAGIEYMHCSGLGFGLRDAPQLDSYEKGESIVKVIAGVDLGGTAINYTILNAREEFLIAGLCEHPALSTQGPDVCLAQIEKGLEIAAGKAGVPLNDVVAVGLDTPGPASSTGVLSARGSTNFVHCDWSGYDIRQKLEARLGRPVT